MTRLRTLAHGLKIAVPLVIAYFVGRVIVANWHQVQDADWRFSPPYLVGAALLCSPWFLARPLGWNVIVNRFGRHVPYPAVYRVVRQAELSRFVPGGVWQFVSRVYLIKKWRVTASAALAATIIDLVLAALAAIIPALWSLGEALPNLARFQRVMLWVFPFISIAVVHPKIFNAWAGLLAKRLGQDWADLEIRWSMLLGIWALYVVAWIALCAGVALFVRGVIDVGPHGTMFIGSSYAAAWLAGTLAMIAPAGMGIREGALGLLLTRLMPQGPAFTLAVAIRFWLLLMEVVWVAVGALLPNPEPPDIEPQ